MLISRENAELRDKILFGEPYDESKYSCGIRHFDNMTFNDYAKLLKIGAIDKADRQNLAPKASSIAGFLRKHPGFRGHGYAVSVNRDDCRVSIEGVSCYEPYTQEDIIAFFRLFKNADEITIGEDGLRCWFD